MTKRMAWVVLVFCAAAVSVSAQTFTTLTSFDGTNGSQPEGQLVQGLDGNLYGTTFEGGEINTQVCGAPGCGTVFSISSAGELNTLYSFCPEPECTQGDPQTGLTQGSDGNLYGTLYNGGIFKITPEGALTTIWTSCGDICSGPLIQANDGSFYGTDTLSSYGNGDAFKITPEGALTVINASLSGYPLALALGADGNFYGVTADGGNVADCPNFGGCGTVFRLTPAGVLTTLYSFTGYSDGEDPNGPLVVATDGSLYGTTRCCPFYTGGTVFKVSPAGQLTTLHTFCSQSDCSDGAYPVNGLTQATDGNFYGTTFLGGLKADGGPGIIFRITPAGVFTILHRFGGPDGLEPYGPLVQATDGSFYGTTYGGGTNKLGVVFNLSLGLAPFVETLPTSRIAGGHVIILGNNLAGTTAVSFNGTTAAFNIVSDTEITATVPSGATSGFITVTGDGSTLKSNKPFHVIQ
jgi:uncharacterized repeat protein (TIGR03803 family)